MKNILPYKNTSPRIDGSVFVAPNAMVAGDVDIGADCGVWFSCTIRGDVNEIRIGARTNIQDNTVIHVAYKGHGTYIGDDVTIGHGCIIHACTIGDQCLVGMGSCVMDGAVIEAGAMLAAGSLLTPGKTIPSGQLWGGRPARYMRDLNDDEHAHIAWSAEHYVRLAQDYLRDE